ncbi:DUF4197 domain-containing protein [Joostella sp. CR20]|uniref:DUF4197 domain-containing protein n=1 Tax=Joostella sp. CR20 TaxID=2804312 RepID=UPI00313CF3C3
MKKIVMASLLATSVLLTNCTSLNTGGTTTQNSNIPLNTVQSVLNNGTQEAFSVFGDSNEFMTNALIDAAMPQQLKDINSKLTSLGLSSIVEKEQALISDIANASITTAKPIVTKAINEMTAQDAISIISGGKGAATSYLKDKTYTDLINAITPVVSQKTEALGVNDLLNNALGANSSSLNSILGSVLGTSTTTNNTSDILTDAVTKQLTDGLFNIVEDTENNVRSNPSTILNSVLSN